MTRALTDSITTPLAVDRSRKMISSMVSSTIARTSGAGWPWLGPLPAATAWRGLRARTTNTTRATVETTAHRVRRSTSEVYRLLAEDALQAPANRAEYPLDGTPHALFH